VKKVKVGISTNGFCGIHGKVIGRVAL